jgi:diguanylate cyclase (GGDEF)-like protein
MPRRIPDPPSDMTLHEHLRQKAVIVAEFDERQRNCVAAILNEAGITNLVFAADQNDIFKKLRSYQYRLEAVGLIILSDALLEQKTKDFCASVASVESGFGIPVIVLKDEDSFANIQQFVPLNALGFHIVAKPIRVREFLPIVNLCLMLRNERHLRQRQEEQLINQLSERKIMEARLKYLVGHDELTGLANRRTLETKLQAAIHRCINFKQESALLYLDLDHFNLINDIEGHETGERLLLAVINLLHANLDGEHFASRIGFDEFCIYLDGASRQQALSIAERLRLALNEFRFTTGNDSYRISASIGIALLQASRHIDHANQLIADAHQACYTAKKNGRNTVYLYNDQNVEVYTRHKDMAWLPLIREALIDNRFFMVFQPVVRLADGLIMHYEVLIRMKGKGGEVFTPGEFIPVAERMGLIHQIDLWVVENAIDFLAAMPEQSTVNLTINLSGYAFQDQALLPLIQRKLDTTWISASRITFEITETAMIGGFEQTREMIARIRSLGYRFALDDFGSGFSSFDYIKRFPADFLKIDGQFIQNLQDDETDQVLVKAMIDIARKLGKQTVAEYVETPRVLDLLISLGVDFAQGYLLGKPSTQLLPNQHLALGDYLRPSLPLSKSAPSNRSPTN